MVSRMLTMFFAGDQLSTASETLFGLLYNNAHLELLFKNVDLSIYFTEAFRIRIVVPSIFRLQSKEVRTAFPAIDMSKIEVLLYTHDKEFSCIQIKDFVVKSKYITLDAENRRIEIPALSAPYTPSIASYYSKTKLFVSSVNVVIPFDLSHLVGAIKDIAEFATKCAEKIVLPPPPVKCPSSSNDDFSIIDLPSELALKVSSIVVSMMHSPVNVN